MANRTTKAACKLVAHRSLGRYITSDKRGRLRLDRAMIKSEERLDGKYLATR